MQNSTNLPFLLLRYWLTGHNTTVTPSCVGSAEADLRPANLQERRFLASTGVFPGTPSRATLMSVKAACAALQSYRVPADHVKALAEVARAPKLTQKQLRSLPPVTPSLPEAPQDPSKEDPATSKQRLQPKPSQPVKQPAAAALAGLLASAKAAGGAGCAQAQPHASTCRAPPGPAAAGRQGQKEAWSPHPSDTEPQEQQAVGASQGEEVDSESQPTQSYSDKPSQNGPEPSAFGGTGSLPPISEGPAISCESKSLETFLQL